MTNPTDHAIARIEVLPDYRIQVLWAGGDCVVIDFAREVWAGPVWEPLRDPTAFGRARVTEQGRVLQWPTPADRWGDPIIEIDSDGLWHMAREQTIAHATA